MAKISKQEEWDNLRTWPRRAIKKMIYLTLPRIGRASKNGLPERVVLVHLENLGDFILFSSIIREVRANFPNSQLVVVAQKENKELVEYCQIVDEWIWVPGHKTPKSGESTGQEVGYFYKILSVYFILFMKFRRDIDLLIGPDWLLTKGSDQFVKNILYKKANVIGGYASKYLKICPAKYVDKAHQVPRMQSIIEMIGLSASNYEPQSWLLPEISHSSEMEESKSLSLKPKIVISLGAGHYRRNWPTEHFPKVISDIHAIWPEIEFQIIGPRSLISPELCNLFAGLAGTQELIGKTDLHSAAKLISKASLVIVNDSGFAHLSASLSVPTLVISAHPLDADPWHLHSPNRYHPWGTEYIEVQPLHLLSPCVDSCQAPGPHCIKTITPEEVVTVALSILEKTRGK